MELTGKAKEAFDKWFDDYSQKHHQKEWLDNDLYLDEVYLPDEVLNALIIEWLDSVGIYVETGVYPCQEDGNIYFSGSFFGKLGGWDDQEYYTSRQQATEKAIERAVELFNGRNND